MTDDFKTWLANSNANNIMWVIEMAKKGVRVTEGGGNDPMNVFLYDLECRCKDYLETHNY